MQYSMRSEYLRQRLQVQRFGQIVIPVDTAKIGLHEDATGLLESMTEQVAAEAGLSAHQIADRLFDYVFRLEPSGVLVLVIQVPERDVEMSVELPPVMWKQMSDEDVAAKRKKAGAGVS